ncbi:hypothetical protein LTR41_003100 [Exophiala xenobiotica]|nr:hypothetical protein LTR41_003100 [Exophiala xenobiotica]
MPGLRPSLLVLLGVLVCLPVWYFCWTLDQNLLAGRRCSDLPQTGRWANPLWQGNASQFWVPPGCMLHSYGPSDARLCLSNRTLTLRGDSTARQLFQTIGSTLGKDVAMNTRTDIEHHKNCTWAGSPNLVMIWDPLLIGLPQRRMEFVDCDSQSRCDTGIELSMTAGRLRHVERATSPVLLHNLPDKPNDESSGGTLLRSFPRMLDRWPTTSNASDLEMPRQVISAQAQVLLNYMCNDIATVPANRSQAYCCVPYTNPHFLQKAFLITGACMMVYPILVLMIQVRLNSSHNPSSRYVARPTRLVWASATVSFAAIYCFAADRTAYFEKNPKSVDQNMFMCLSAAALLAGLATSKKSCSAPANTGTKPYSSRQQPLARGQTEEWKGWMQITILLYHYFGMSKVLWVYQFIRLCVSSYLFMTGYGHTIYFLETKDFSLQRAVNVLLRTNLLNVVLAFVMGTHYDLYYFPALSTVWFLIIWFTIPKNAAMQANTWRLMSRIVLSSAIVSLAIRYGEVMETWLAILNDLALGMPVIDGREFLFRFSLDAYVVYFGMVAAVLYSRHTSRDPRFCQVYRPKLTMPIAVLMATCILVGYSVLCAQFLNKYQYNKWHPCVSPWVVVAFAVLRNSTSLLRSSHSRLFAWFGRCSLETFVLQYHIWLAADAHGLLRLGLANGLLYKYQVGGSYIYDMLDTAIISATFLCISNAVSLAIPVITASFVGRTSKHGALMQWKEQSENVSQTNKVSLMSRTPGLGARLIIAVAILWILNLIWTCFG